MPSFTITISQQAHARLRKLKGPRESFSEVILRELPVRCETAGEIEDYYRNQGVPPANPKLKAAMLAGRGRRSKRA